MKDGFVRKKYCMILLSTKSEDWVYMSNIIILTLTNGCHVYEIVKNGCHK